MKLYLAIDKIADLFHPPAVDAEIAVADPRGGAKMNRLSLLIEEELDIIHEAEQETREFKVQVRLLFFDKLDARQLENEAFQRGLCLGGVLFVSERRNRMLLVMS